MSMLLGGYGEGACAIGVIGPWEVKSEAGTLGGEGGGWASMKAGAVVVPSWAETPAVEVAV